VKIAEQFERDWNEGKIFKPFRLLKDLENNAQEYLHLFILKAAVIV